MMRCRTSSLKSNKCKEKSKRTGRHNSDVSIHNFDDNFIDEILRVNQVSVKCSWKVVPKDSCEVYRNRKKRKGHPQKKRDESDDYSDSESQRTSGRDVKNKTQDDRRIKKRLTFKKKSKNQRRKKSTHTPSVSSCTCTSMSTSCISCNSEID